MTQITVAAVGDILIDRSEPDTAFDGVRHILGAADLLYGNCEGPYSDTAERNPSSAGWLRAAPRNFEAIRNLGFTAMSLANNHILDAGYSGLRDTIALLEASGTRAVGAGEDLAAARRPLLTETGGVRVAFLAFTCVYPPGFEADEHRPGCATIKVHDLYRGELGQPGTRPIVQTVVDPEEKRTVLGCVRAARELADIVIVSVHWGIHKLPAVITDYERELGRDLVEHGADLVFGHHQHILKGFEVHQGKPILYGVGNFIFDVQRGRSPREMSLRTSELDPFKAFYTATETAAAERGSYPFASDAHWTMVVRLRASRHGVEEVAILPCRVNAQGTPEPVARESAAFDVYVAYLQAITAEAGLGGSVTAHDGALVIDGVLAGAPQQ